MKVHNMMEGLVFDCLKELITRHPELDKQLDDLKFSDVLAIALNRLPTKYVTTEKGGILTKTQLRTKHESDVFRELTHAVEIVLGQQRPKDF